MRSTTSNKSTIGKKDRGFTLVEMIISLAIFSIVAVVALGALIKIIDANKKAQTLQSSITNLNFALESMSREMRVGTTYYCARGAGSYSHANRGEMDDAKKSQDFAKPPGDNTCDDGFGTGDEDRMIAFYSSKFDKTITDCPLIIAYIVVNPYQDHGQDPQYPNQWLLEKAQQPSCDVPFSELMFTPVVSTDLIITDFRMGVSAVSETPNKPYPMAFVRLSGYAGSREKERTYFDVQTAVSSRLR